MALSGTSTAAPSPQLTVSAGSLSFGSVTVNTATTQSLTLTSTGTAPVTVSSAAITGTGFAFVGGTLPVTLNPTQSMTLQVQFVPTAAGTVNGQITISSNSSSGDTAVVALSGTSIAAPSPQLTVSAGSLSFGGVTVNTATTQTLTLTSTGTSPVTVSSAAITGAGFTIVGGSLPATLNPTQSLTLQVQFQPTSTGTASGQIAISSDSSTGSTAVVALSGTSIAAPSPQLTVSAGSLSFGSVTVNTATTQTLTLTSTGTSPVTVSSAAITGAGFTIVGGTLPATLNPTQSLTLQVQFQPTTTGTASGQIAISSDSSTGSTAVVALSGTSIAAPSPQLTVSAGSLSFGSVTVNTATTQTLTLTSTGTSPVTVSSAAITGAGFTIVGGTLPATLNPTQSLTLQVQFQPTSTGTASGQITISSNSSTGSTAVVALSGTSTGAPSPQLAVSTASVSFGSVTVNTATTQTLTLTSTGTSPVTVSSAAITGAGFTIVGGTLPATLNPTQSLTLQVQFQPTSTGTASGQITITSNSSTGSTAVVALSGTSVAAPSPQLTVSAGSLSFGSVTVNTATTQTLTLTSTGTSPVTVSSAAITGAGFTIVGGSSAGDVEPDAVADASGAVPADLDWDSQWTDHDQQQLVDRFHGRSGSERYEHSGTESAVDGERWEFEFRQRDGEHGDDADVDADVDWNVAGDGELGCDHWCWLYDRRWYSAGDTEPDAVADASGAVPADLDWDRQWTDHDQQQLVDRLDGRSGSERYEHRGTESAVDGERWKSEFRQRDGEHGDDADVDADVDWNGASDGELGCDHWCWLYDRRWYSAGDAEPDAVADASGAVPADLDWDSQWTDHDQQQLVDRLHGRSGSERYEHSGTESAVDGERWKSELRQRDGEHGDDADVDTDVDWDVAGDGELGCDHWRWLHDRRWYSAGDAEPDAVADASGAVPADLDWDSQWTDHDHQRFVDRLDGRSGSERYERSGTESAVDGERWESELWQRDGEHGDDADVDADVDWNVAGDGELGCDHRRWLHDRRWYSAGDTEPDAVADASGAVPADLDWDSQWTDHYQQRFVDRLDGRSGSERYEHSGTESAVDGERWKSELRQRDGEHGDDADVDADVDWNVASDGELGCDHWRWLHDRRWYSAGDAEPDAVADASGAVPADLDWDSQWTDHDLQRFVDRFHGRGGSERYEHSGTEPAVDGERWKSEFRQRDGEHGDDADVDADVDWDVAGDGELGCDHWRWLHDRRWYSAGDTEPDAVADASGAVPADLDWDSQWTDHDHQRLFDGSTAVVALSGTSIAAPSPQLTVSAGSLSFGSVTVNTATTQTLTLTSTGTAPVTVSSAAITGAGFTIVGGTLPATLNPTQSLTLQVQFQPTSTGTASGQITISSDSSTGSTAVVALGGTSVAAPSPQLTVSAGSLSFGSVTVNTATTQIADADVDGNGAGDGELCCDHRRWLHDRRWHFAGDTEPDAVADASGAVPADLDWDSQWTDHDQQRLVDRLDGRSGSERYEHSGTESAVDGERWESEFWQRDGEHGDDADVDADVDWDVAGDGELGCDHWCWLHDRRWYSAGDTEPDAVADASGAVPADLDWDSQWTDHDHQRFVDRFHGRSGSERYEHSGTESTVDGERWQSELWQRDGEHGDDADVDADVDWDISGDSELGCDHWRWLHDRSSELPDYTKPDAVADASGAVSADIDWDSQWPNHDLQQLNNGWHGLSGSGRYRYGSESTIDHKHWKSRLR